MFGYYFELAVRSLKRNVVLTVLMIAAVGVGIGASMTMFTTLRAMSGDPIPDKSAKLFVPTIDVWGPDSQRAQSGDQLPDQLTYRDAMALMRAHRGVRQTAMYSIGMDIDPGSGKPFKRRAEPPMGTSLLCSKFPSAQGLLGARWMTRITATWWC